MNQSSILFYRGKATDVYVLTDINCVFCITKGFQPSAVYREQALAQISAFEQYQAHGIIWDLREAEVITKEDQDWTVNEWQPRAVAAGYRRGAIVIPESIFGQLSVKKVISQVQNLHREVDLSIQYFSDVNEAYQWMKAELAVLV